MTRADLLLRCDIQRILNHGILDRDPRPKYSDGTPAHTYFVTHNIRTYHLDKGEFPICTLRPISWKTAIKEVLWIFQEQSNDLKLLNEKYNVKVWNEWESKDYPETVGYRYGHTVKRYDLMNRLLKDIKENPYGRYHIINLWQEEEFIDSDGLKPCAYETIWTVRGEYLDMFLTQRSGDMLVASGAGNFNEVQYAALLMMVAKATGYKAGKFTHAVINEQIYDKHIEQAKELVARCENLKSKGGAYDYEFDKVEMKFNPKSDDFYSFTVDDFELVGYEPMKPQLTFDLGI